jgi:neuropeptide S receptor 1
VPGNSAVLTVLVTSKGRKSRMNFFIKHLAAADLCVGLVSVLTDIIWKITISWEAGLVACKLIRFLQVLGRVRGCNRARVTRSGESSPNR